MKYYFYALIVFFYALPAHAQNTQLPNPLGTTDPRVIAGTIIKGFISISGTIALLMFIYGGFLWMTAMGKPEVVDKGKKILLWTTLGIIIIASAYVLTTAVFNAITTGNAS